MIGTKLYIGTPIDISVTNTPTLFAALTWTEIKNATMVGKTGDTYAPIRNEVLSDGRVHYSKGVADGGSPQIEYLPIPADPGQALVAAALLATGDYAFKVLYNDKPLAGTSGTIDYFGALVMGNAKANGTTSTSLKIQFALAINSAIISVPAV